MSADQLAQFDANIETAVGQVKHCLLALMRPLVQGRTVILTGSVTNSVSLADALVEAGAREVARLDMSLDTDAPIHLQLSNMEALIAHPLPSVQQMLQTIDPMGQALVYAGSFTAQPFMGGREIIGARSRLHVEAERKDRQWEYMGKLVSTERFLIELSNEDTVLQTVAALVRHSPTIISGIPDDSIAMGSSHTYLIMEKMTTQDTTLGSDVIYSLTQDCQRAMLSTFDRGIPCTYYGYVSRNWVIDFGPFRGLVYWNRRTCQIWAPGIMRPLLLNDLQRQAAQSAVHSAARRLCEKTGYTGAFCTDGVMQASQYIVHDINPRICAGFSLLGELCQGQLPFTLVDLVLRTYPLEADEILSTPLSQLAWLLQMQKRLVKLWNTHANPLEKEMRRRADEIGDSELWAAQVQHLLADDNHIPLEDL